MSSEDIAGLDDTQLNAIGCEPPEAREERARALSQAAALDAVIRTCRRHGGQSSTKPTVPAPQIQSPDLSQMFSSMNMRADGIQMPSIPDKKAEAIGQGGISNGLLTPMASQDRRTPSPTPVVDSKRRRLAELTAGNMRRQGIGRSASGTWGGMQPTVTDDTEDEL